MAKRRSANRRWSRRSGNITDFLDQHSNVVDSHNALWWKEIEEDLTMRPSGLFTNANTTSITLLEDSRVNLSELKDEWWNDLEKSTTQEHPKNISQHKIANENDTGQETTHSESEDSIKKPKVLLGTKRKMSEHTDVFQKALNESNVTIQSEPVTNKKRKSKSSVASDTEALYRKTKRQSRSGQRLSENKQYSNLNSSNESDVILKRRGHIMKKLTQPSNSVYDEILNESRAGPSGIDSAAVATQSFNSPRAKSSMQPRITYLNLSSSGSASQDAAAIIDKSSDLPELRHTMRHISNNKDYSAISQNLLTANENSAKGIKRKHIFSRKSTKNESTNLFDDIISGHSKEKSLLLTNEMINNTDANNVTENNILISEPMLEISLSGNQTKKLAANNISSNSATSIQILEPNKNTTVNEEAIDDANSVDLPRTTLNSKSLLKRKSNDSNDKTEINQQKMILSPITEVYSQNQQSLGEPLTENKSENEECVDKAGKSLIESSNLMTSFKRGLQTSRIMSSTKIVHSLQIRDSEGTTDEEEDNLITKTPISVRRSRIITEASYDLPNHERSSSVVPSTPECEIENITEDPRVENQSFDKSKNASLLQKKNKSFDKDPNQLNISIQHTDSDISISKEGTPAAEVLNRLSQRNSRTHEKSIESKRKVSRASASRRLIESDSTSSKEEPEIRRKSIRKSVKNLQTIEAQKESFKRTNTSRQQTDSDDATVELNLPVMQKSKYKSTRKFEANRYTRSSEKSGGGNMNKSRQRIQSDTGSSTEENFSNAEKSIRESKRISHAEKATNASKKTDGLSNKSLQENEPEEANITNAENSRVVEKSRGKTTRTSHIDPDVRKFVKRISGDNKQVNATQLRIQSDIGSTSEEDSPIAEKSKRKSKRISYAEKTTNASKKPDGLSNKSLQEIELEEANISNAGSSQILEKSRRKATRTSHAELHARKSVKRVSGDNKQVNTSRLRIQSNTDNTSEEDSPIAEKSKRKSKRISQVVEATSKKIDDLSTRSPQEIEPEVNISNAGSSQIVEKSRDKTTRTSHADPHARRSVKRVSGHIKQVNTSRLRIQSDTDSTSEEDLPVSEKSNRRSMAILHTEEVADTPVKSIARGNISERQFNWDDSDSEEYLPQLMHSTKNQITPTKARPSSSKIEAPINTENDNSSFVAQTSERDISTSISAEIPVLKELPISRVNTSIISRSKPNVSRIQTPITNFLRVTNPKEADQSQVPKDLPIVDKEKWDVAKRHMEKIKNEEMAKMKIRLDDKNKPVVSTRLPQPASKAKFLKNKATATKPTTKAPKVVDKAYIVNGKVYKRPKLPRPKPWVTNRLYNHLWKRMEPKFGLSTRIRSEKFVQELSDVVDLTIRRKKYESYKLEVDALMREMARLGIIVSRNDFYHFCYDFLPYTFRVKVTPILLPGNVSNIPYDPETLHVPIDREP